MEVNKEKKEKNKLIPYFIPLVVLLIIMTATVSTYGSRISKDMRNKVQDDYFDYADEMAHIYNVRIEALKESVRVCAGLFATEQNLFDIVSNIDSFTKDDDVSDVYIVDINGDGVKKIGGSTDFFKSNEELFKSFETKPGYTKFTLNEKNQYVM